MKLKNLLTIAALIVGGGSLRAQTNLVANWDGGTDTSSPSNFGWTSSANRTLQPRNNNGGIRMTTTYSDYKLEDNSSYSYSATSDLSSVIFWLRYNTAGESFTYTFQGLEADTYYDFSGLVGWHNNSNAPTLTVVFNDGTNTLATVSKTVSAKQTLYAINSRFKTPSTMTSTTDVKMVFTCNQTGDCMEAVSALSLVKVDLVLKDDLEAAIAYATVANTYLSNSDLTTAIATAQEVYVDANATQSGVNSAVTTLNAAVSTAINADPLTLINPGFEDCSVTTTNAAAVAAAAPLDIDGGWTQTSSAGWSSSAVVAYGGAGQVNGVSAPSADNASNSGNALGVSVGWDGTVTYQTSSAITLPMGYYTLTVYGNNQNSGATQFKSLNGFVTTGASHLSSKTSFTYNTWEADEVHFTLTEATEGKIQVGGQAVSGGSGSNAKVFFDNITLSYKSFETAWTENKADAQDVLNDATYAAITGAERTAVTTAMAATPSTAAEYETAFSNLETAVNAFTASVGDYTTLAAEQTKATALGMTAEQISAVVSTSNTAIVNTQALKVAEYNYVTTNYGYGVELGTWTAEGPTGSKDEQHWSGEQRPYLEQSGAAWGQSAWEIKYSQNVTLPAGSYVFKVAGRQADSDGVTLSLEVKNGETLLGTVSDFPRADVGYGINTIGETDYDPSHSYANNNAGRGWEWRYVKFTLDDLATVNVAVSAVATTAHMWVSFCDATVQATSADVAALLAALTAYDAALAAATDAINNTAYVNVRGLERTDLQEAIDADGTLDKSSLDDVQAATNALTVNTGSFTGAMDSYNAFYQAKSEQTLTKITENVGDGVFQYNPTTNNDLYSAYQSAKGTVDNFDVTTGTASAVKSYADALNGAINAYNTQALNAPAADKRYYLNIVDAGQSWDGNAVTFIAGGRNDMGNYAIQYLAPANVYMNQALKFTAVDGEVNTYIVSAINVEDGAERYITTGNTYSGGYATQICTTDDVTKASWIKIQATTTTGQFQLLNVSDGNKVIGRNATNPDNGMYTDGNNSFTIAEASQAEVTVSCKAGKYGTVIFPFTPDVSSGFNGIKFYSTDGVNGATQKVQITEVAEPVANVPYLIKNDNGEDFSKDDVTGWGTATADSYTDGLLTGVYTASAITHDANNYVLQTQAEKGQGFYLVKETDFTATPYKCYLTYSAAGVKFLGFDFGDATGISEIANGEQPTANSPIFNLAGQRVSKAQKGLYIVNGKKVMVK